MLVMATTLIFGTFMDKVQKFLVPPRGAGDNNRHPSHDSHSHYEEIVHPNEEKSMISDISRVSHRPSYLLGDIPSGGWVNSCFVNWFVTFDETKLRPWLIRDYSLKQIRIQENYMDAFFRT